MTLYIFARYSPYSRIIHVWTFSLSLPTSPGRPAPRIEELVAGLAAGEKHQVLLGVTGSGKTFTMAKVIEQSTGRR